jgi:ATP-dependent Lhr-like helicase
VGGFPREVLDGLWSLVWAGEATNDTLEPLRSLAASGGREATRTSPRHPRRPSPAPSLPGSEGRWSLRRTPGTDAPSATERSAALARVLLDRYGVLTREAVHAEGIAGGFSAVYDVLKAMEDRGRARRGYFLAGRGATQFALPGADDRLRAARDGGDAPRTFVLAATDPANPYGASLPWPSRGGEAEQERRPQRAAGALAVMHDGALVGWLARGAESLLTFLPRDEAEREKAADALATALAGLVDSGERRALLVVTIDGEPAAGSGLRGALERAGFGVSREGALKRREGGRSER